MVRTDTMSKATPWIVLFVIGGSIAAWYFSARETPVDHPSVISLSVQTAVEPEPEASYPVDAISAPEESLPEPLPSLQDSDRSMVEAMAGLVGAESLGRYFVLEELISRIVTTIDSLDSRQLAPLVMPTKPPSGDFLVAGGDSLTLHPDNSQRYSAFVRIASAVDVDDVVGLYLRYYPLFQEAYESLGYGDAYFNDRLVEVLDHLLATPLATDDPVLVKSEAVYLFQDDSLESLSAGQKILLRIGISNAAVMIEKIQEIRSLVTRQEA